MGSARRASSSTPSMPTRRSTASARRQHHGAAASGQGVSLRRKHRHYPAVRSSTVERDRDRYRHSSRCSPQITARRSTLWLPEASGSFGVRPSEPSRRAPYAAVATMGVIRQRGAGGVWAQARGRAHSRYGFPGCIPDVWKRLPVTWRHRTMASMGSFWAGLRPTEEPAWLTQ
jgi:hypothetical protein